MSQNFNPALDWSDEKIRATLHPAVNASINANGWDLGAVPKEHRSQYVCAHFVHHDPRNLRYCPLRCRTDEICRDAVERDPFTLEFCGMQTVPFCISVVRRCGWALSCVQPHLRYADVCEAALRDGGGADDEMVWKNVPDSVLPELERRGLVKPDFEARWNVPF